MAIRKESFLRGIVGIVGAFAVYTSANFLDSAFINSTQYNHSQAGGQRQTQSINQSSKPDNFNYSFTNFGEFGFPKYHEVKSISSADLDNDGDNDLAVLYEDTYGRNKCIFLKTRCRGKNE